MCLSVSDGISLGIGLVTILVSVASCSVAFWAIWLTKKEIRIQNERDLLDKRLNNYIACRTVYDSVKDSIGILPKKEQRDRLLELEPLFHKLLGRGFLRKGRVIIKGSLEDENRDNFLKIRESIKNMADKCRILFDGEEKNLMYDFLFSYDEVLMAMLNYQELMDNNEEYPLMAKEEYRPEYAMKVENASGDLRKKYKLLEEKGVLDKMYSEIEISKI